MSKDTQADMDDVTAPERFYLPAIKKMRVFLMICAILYTYGLHSLWNDYIGVIFGFAFPALYIISGYVVLRESPNIEKRLLRAIGRTAVCFVILFLVYFVLSLIVDKNTTLTYVTSKYFWFNFLVVNLWTLPIGPTIWFVQALLYAYLIIYVIYKLKLLKFDIYLAALCLVVTLLTGELSTLVGFRMLGYVNLGGNFLTRALPYILIGRFIGRKEQFFGNFGFIQHLGMFIAGVALTAGEYFALKLTGNLGYSGHFLGMGLIAVTFCLFCFFVIGSELHIPLLKMLSRYEIAIPFFICSPVNYCLIRFLQRDDTLASYFGDYTGALTLILSFLALFIYSIIRAVVLAILPDRGEETEWEPVEETGGDASSKTNTPE